MHCFRSKDEDLCLFTRTNDHNWETFKLFNVFHHDGQCNMHLRSKL